MAMGASDSAKRLSSTVLWRGREFSLRPSVLSTAVVSSPLFTSAVTRWPVNGSIMQKPTCFLPFGERPRFNMDGEE